MKIEVIRTKVERYLVEAESVKEAEDSIKVYAKEPDKVEEFTNYILDKNRQYETESES